MVEVIKINNNKTWRVIKSERSTGTCYKVQWSWGGCWREDSKYKTRRGAVNRYDKMMEKYK